MKACTCFQAILIVGIICLVSYHSRAQDEKTEPDTLRNMAAKVFIDCGFCDLDYIRKEIPFVNYVRDWKEAQVHVLFTRQRTGSGGIEYTVLFIGQGDFEGMDDTLVYVTGPNDTEEEVRMESAQTLKLGLMHYVAQTPLGRQITIKYDSPIDPVAMEDKWNNFVFEIDLGGWFNGEQATSSTMIWSSLSMSRITPEWKIELDANANYRERKFQIADETILSIIRSQSFNALLVKSLGEHWSVGGFARVSSSIFNNEKLKYRIAPALEYNFFPYSESTRKQLRFLYKVGFTYSYYNDTTIFNKMEEGLFHENLGVAFEIKDKWGSINTYLEGFHYFHDFSKNRLWLGSELSLRLFKGFSLRMSGGYSLIHDQLSIPKGGATDEDILLQQKQLLTQYRYWGSVGINYTFGSIYNNVVNPRFGN